MGPMGVNFNTLQTLFIGDRSQIILKEQARCPAST